MYIFFKISYFGRGNSIHYIACLIFRNQYIVKHVIPKFFVHLIVNTYLLKFTQVTQSVLLIGWLVGWFYSMPTLIGLCNAKVFFKAIIWFQVFLSHTYHLYMIIWFQIFLFHANNLYMIILFQVFLSNTNNSYMIIWFQVTIPIY